MRIVLVLPGLLALVLACDAKPKVEPKAEASEPEASAKSPTPAPAPTLAPAPAGTVILDGAYVHTCASPESCPLLLQDAGAAHCKALTLGGLGWRLPTLAELESWTRKPELVGYDVFHWSGSAWDEDPGQFWIFDPGSGAKTTAKPDRKPFTIRCVARP